MRAAVLLALLASILFSHVGCVTQEKVSGEEIPVSDVTQETKPIVLEEFELGSGDVIEITVWRNDDLYRKIQIGPTGLISYPLAGTIQVGGLSIFQLRDEISKALSEYLVDPQVGIYVVSYQSRKVLVLGEVNRPGVFQSLGRVSALEAVSMAGGFTLDAKPKTTLLVRGGLDSPELMTLNLEDVLKKGDITQNVSLQPGDILYVPVSPFASAERFFKRIDSILRPIVRLESGIILEPTVEDVLRGKDVTQGVIVAPR